MKSLIMKKLFGAIVFICVAVSLASAQLPTPNFFPSTSSTAITGNVGGPTNFNSPFSLQFITHVSPGWSNGTTYSIGQTVSLLDTNSQVPKGEYVSLQNSNTNQNPATATTFWQLFTAAPTFCYTVTGGLTGTTPTASTPGTCDSSPTQTFTAPFMLSGTVTVAAIETQTGQINSPVLSFTYVIPSFFPAAGVSYVGARTVQLSVSQGSVPIYTIDGSTPTNNGGACTALNGTATTNGGTISVVATTTVEILPCSGAGVTGTVVTGVFTINGSAQAWYIRADGGTRFSSHVASGQCDGLADVAYPGTGTNQHCAFNDYRYLWDDDSGAVGLGAWVIAGGDTVIIRGCTALASQTNPANPACRIGWDQITGASPNNWCKAIGSSGCTNPPIPAGSASLHTRFLGQNFATCNTGGATNPKLYASNLTQLYGGFSLSKIINLKSTQNVDFSCIELTTHNSTSPRTAWSSGTTYANGPGFSATVSFGGLNYVSIQAGNLNNQPDVSPTFWRLAPNCTTLGAPVYPTGCSTSSPTDDYGANGFWTNSQTSNITFTDVYVHGMGSSGFFGPIGGPITMTRMFIGFNGFAGLNYDDGFSTPDGAGSSITATHVIQAGNGCFEQYPIVDAFPARVCYDTNSGGFGDSWSGQNTQMDFMICNDCQQLYNTKDGFIGPHTWITNLTVKNSLWVGNMGQSLKWGGFNVPTSLLLTDNLIVGNCNRMSQPLTGAPANYNQFLGGFCRSAGNLVASVIPTGSTWVVANNSWATYMPTIFDLACPGLFVGACTSTFNLTNNVILGYVNTTYPSSSGQAPSLYFTTGSIGIGIVSKNNVEFGLRNNPECPTGTNGNVCLNPLLVGEPAQGTIPPESVLDGFNFHLTGSSPAIGAGITYTGAPTTDYDGVLTTSPPVIGALNFFSSVLHGSTFGTGSFTGTGVTF